MNWDDLRFLRSIYQMGSFAAAAKHLRVNETTVARRLNRLEDDLGVTLFEAIDGARHPTVMCENIVSRVETMASQAEQIIRIEPGYEGLVGRRRIAATDSIAAEILAPRAAAFLENHPGVQLDFLVSTENINFSRWEADLAIRLAKPDRGDFAISKLIDFDLYFFEPAEQPEAEKAMICAFPESLEDTPEMLYLFKAGLQNRIRITTKNLLVLRQLVRSGRCCGVLMSFACMDLLDDPALKATRLSQKRGVWLLVQPHLQREPLTRLIIDWIRDCFRDLPGSMSGHR